MYYLLNVSLLVVLSTLSLFSYSSERATWDQALSKALNRKPHSALTLLQDRYASLSLGAEKLYVKSRIHEYMTQNGQLYFSSNSPPQSSYHKLENLFIEALNYEQTKEYSQAEKIYRDLYTHMEQTLDRDGSLLFAYHLCQLFNRQSQAEQSKKYCRQLEASNDKSNNSIIPNHRILAVLAKNHELLGNHHSALKAYQQLIEQLPEDRNPAGIFNDIGLVLCSLKQYDHALSYLSRAITLYTEDNIESGIAQSEYNTGEIYYHKSDLHKSIIHFNKARLMFTKLNHLSGLAKVHLGLGKAHIELEHFNEGANSLLKALDYIAKSPDISLKTEINLALSDSYLQRHNYKQAEHYAHSAYLFAIDSQNTHQQTQSLLKLAKISEIQEQFEQASSYYRQYIEKANPTHSSEHQHFTASFEASQLEQKHKVAHSEVLSENDRLQYYINELKMERRYLLFFVAISLLSIAYILHRSHLRMNSQQIDCLTGALHRTAFIKKFQCIEQKTDSDTDDLAILFNIDNLKTINDRYSYEIGNKILKEISNIIESHVTKHDLWGRLGAEEFIVILKDVDHCEIQQRVETLHKVLTATTYYIENHQPLCISANFAFMASDKLPNDFDEFYSILDRALYRAKQDGKNSIVNAKNPPIKQIASVVELP